MNEWYIGHYSKEEKGMMTKGEVVKEKLDADWLASMIKFMKDSNNIIVTIHFLENNRVEVSLPVSAYFDSSYKFVDATMVTLPKDKAELALALISIKEHVLESDRVGIKYNLDKLRVIYGHDKEANHYIDLLDKLQNEIKVLTN